MSTSQEKVEKGVEFALLLYSLSWGKKGIKYY